MGVPLTEEEEGEEEQQPSSPNAFGPKLSSMSDHDDDSGFLELPRKKKIFSSSSFYEEPNAIYPTVEEQVEMCRKIADSLCDDCNKKSRGANMFFKRVKRAEKWVVQTSAMFGGGDSQSLDNTVLDPAAMPYVKISKEPPKLKLILDPRHMIDLKRLREEGVQIVEHNSVSKDLCQNIVNDLNSPTGKGAQLFAKRKKKSMDWVVDEEKVKAHLKQIQDRERGIFTPEPPQGFAGGRPISSDDVAETVIRAAEAKIMSYPAPRHFAIEPAQYYSEPKAYEPQPLVQSRLASGQSSTPAVSSIRPEVYSCRAPRGWTSVSQITASSVLENKNAKADDMPQYASLPRLPSHTLPQNYPTSRTYSFCNFNNTPKAWSSVEAPNISKLQIKKIRPPSVLAQ